MSHNGACDQLRKKSHKQSILHKGIIFRSAPVCVHQKPHLLKGEKTDSQRQQHMLQRKIRMEQSIDVLHKKVKIFIIKQHTQIGTHTGHSQIQILSAPPFHASVPLQNPVQSVISQDTSHNNGQIFHIKPRVKPERHGNQPEFAPFIFSPGITAKIPCQCQRQKQ